ncbi:MAG: hypothetical protein BM556_14370 [Bacteriovorax sp. MedPE-SWde]|nr:MAG: hypothetical protein BM556_14370 [Bacteriovorax sp. MedPE-SWde]
MKQLALLICLVLMSRSIVAADKSEKLQFTKEEFKQAVYAELDKKMKSIGRTRLLDFAKELLKKEEALLEKDKVIKKREEQVAVSEEELKKKIVEFKLAQEKFLSCLDKEDKEVDRRISHMVDVVSGMRPQTAANLLSQQDPTISVRILGLLPPTKVAKIFNLMDKEISSRLQKQYMTMKK